MYVRRGSCCPHMFWRKPFIQTAKYRFDLRSVKQEHCKNHEMKVKNRMSICANIHRSGIWPYSRGILRQATDQYRKYIFYLYGNAYCFVRGILRTFVRLKFYSNEDHICCYTNRIQKTKVR